MNTDLFLEKTELRLKDYCNKYFNENSRVGKAAKYSLLGAGKRARAVLIYLVRSLCGQSWESALPLACAVEMIHCYSLIHDDLPCMDDDDMRRGKLSCHVAFDEATALLAGDALPNVAIQLIADDKTISDIDKVKAIQAITDAMGPKGMIWGQELDLKYENTPADKETLNKIHRNKTGKMISLCSSLGSLGSDITDKQKSALKLFFENVGLVFQIVDDILDVEGDRDSLGKPVGSDEGNNKSTFITLYGLEKSKEIANDLSLQGYKAMKDAFGDKADEIIEYADYLLKRKK